MGHPLMMVPLYKLAKTTSILDNASNEYIKEMFKSIEYNILNYEGASNIRDNNTKPYFFNENTIYAKHFEKTKKDFTCNLIEKKIRYKVDVTKAVKRHRRRL